MRNNPDKRNYNRLKINSFTIQYKINDNITVFDAEVINISAGGICFLRTSILEKGDIVQLKFEFSSKKIVLQGEVIRIEGREAAIKFVDSEHQIDRFVEYFNNEFSGFKSKNMLPGNKENVEYDNENENNIFDNEKD